MAKRYDFATKQVVEIEEAVEVPKEVLEEVKTPISTQVQEREQPLVILTETDAYIAERMKEQPKSEEDVVVKFKKEEVDPQTNRVLALPKELSKPKYTNKYAFRWINKNRRAVSRALDVVGWNLVNRSVFPDLPRYLFTGNGSVERGDTILSFMPLKKAEAIRLRPAQISRDRVKNTPVQDLNKWEEKDSGSDKFGYYKPDIGDAEKTEQDSHSIMPDNEEKEN